MKQCGFAAQPQFAIRLQAAGTPPRLATEVTETRRTAASRVANARASRTHAGALKRPECRSAACNARCDRSHIERGVRCADSACGVAAAAPVLPARAPSTISLIQFTSSEV